MTIRLVDSKWAAELTEAMQADASELRIVCPFIKVGALSRLLSKQPESIQVITRFSLSDFAEGVSDINALRALLKRGASIRGIRNLHAKLYLFGARRAIVTSANLTEAAINRNHEFGMVSDDEALIATCRAYFGRLWRLGKRDLSHDQIDEWDKDIRRCLASGGRPKRIAGLRDFGADAGIGPPPDVSLPIAIAEAEQAYVKFLGEGDNRVPLSYPVIDEIRESGCHWAVAYPAKKRPTGVKDAAVILIGRLTSEPSDVRIFGRAIAMKHKPGHDDATPDDIARRAWKATWPRYIRRHHAEFVVGTMANGISLNDLMTALGSDSFRSTQRNAALGEGNINPRKAYRQQAAVELSPQGLSWLSTRLQAAFDTYGVVPRAALDKLDWPKLPTLASL